MNIGNSTLTEGLRIIALAQLHNRIFASALQSGRAQREKAKPGQTSAASVKDR